MAAEPKVSVLLQLVDKLTGPLDGARAGVSRFGGAVKAAGVALAGMVSTAALGAFFKSAIGEALKAEESMIRLGRAVTNAGGNFAASKGAIDAAINSVVRMSKFTDDDLSDALAHLITTTGDVSGSMNNLGLVADIAAYKQIGVQQAAELLGQAMAGNTRAFTQFGIVGGTVEERMEALRTVVHGFAESEAKSMAGRLNAINREWGEFKEQVGLAIIGSDDLGSSVGGLTATLADLNAWMEKNAATIGSVLNTMTNAAAAIGKVGIWIVEHTPNLYTLGKAWDWVRGRTDEATEATRRASGSMSQDMLVMSAAFSQHRALTQAELAALTAAHTEGASNITAVQRNAILQIGAHQREHGLLSIRLNKEQAEVIEAVQRDAATRRQRAATQSNKDLLADDKKATDALVAMRREVLLGGLTALGREMIELKDKLDAAMQSREQSARDDAVAVHQQRVAQILAAHAKLDELKPRMERTHQAMLQITTDWGDQTVPVVRAVWEEYDLLLNSISEVAGEAEEAADTILDFAKEAGIANEEVVNLVGGVANLADGLKQITGATDFAGLLGGIGTMVAGLQGILGSLFGNSPAEQARKQLLQKNTTALDRLRDQIGDLMQAQSPGATIAKFKSLDLTPLAGGGDSKADNLSRLSGLGSLLRSKGLTVSEFEAMLADLDIDLGDWQKNGISTGQLAQIIQGLRNFEPAQFDQSFSGQQDFLQTYFNVAGIDDPAAQMAFAKTHLASKNAFLANMIGQFDLSTAEGRAGLQGKFADLIASMNAPGGPDESIFGQLTGSEFVGFIEYFTDLLQQISGSATPVVPGGDTLGLMTSTTSAPVSVGESTVPAVFAEIAANTLRTADGVDRLVELTEAGNLGTTTITVDGLQLAGSADLSQLGELLAAEIDLTTANRGEA